MDKQKTALLLLAIIATLGLVSSVLEPAFSPKARQQQPGHGKVKTVGVGVYRDLAVTSSLSSINWGMIDPGGSQNYTCYVRNEGSSAVFLALSTTNWNPLKASTLISLSWSYKGQSVVPSEVLEVTFTLSVSPNASGISNFSFDTIVSSSNA